ncbi:MAG TPA: hypothetical protein VMZ91_06090 [Candidatus Paceibacterota bacterium]|nr:hypothetical protein [Candidatus Paceibacterota bacterium]
MKTEEFINRAEKIHGKKYDYSKTLYKNYHSNVNIICNNHGLFKQRASKHLSGQNCPSCSNRKKSTTKEFIEKARKVHNKKYDYSLVDYKNTDFKIKISCKKHGVFEQAPYYHLKGSGCPKCCKNKKSTTKEFIEKSEKIHNKKYDYSLVDYKNNSTKVKIICKTHGVFEQKANGHLSGKGCSRCARCKKLTTEEFVDKSKKIHKNKYDYNKVVYINSDSKIIIICPKHGDFSQVAYGHSVGIGCPNCQESHGERSIVNILAENNINFIRQKRFSNCKYKNVLPFDFYIPKYNTCIEYDGKQHTKSVKYFGGNKTLKEQIKKDKIKNLYCKNNGIELLRISYNDDIENIMLKNFFIKNKLLILQNNKT